MAGISGQTLKGDAHEVYISGVDKKLKLKFNLNALYHLEKQYGDINKAMEEIQNGQVKSLIAITAAALSAGGNRKEPYTEFEVADMINVEDLEPLSRVLELMLGGLKDKGTPSEEV